MPIQINEVIVRAIITGEDAGKQQDSSKGMKETIATVSKEELLELIDEVINTKKER